MYFLQRTDSVSVMGRPRRGPAPRWRARYWRPRREARAAVGRAGTLARILPIRELRPSRDSCALPRTIGERFRGAANSWPCTSRAPANLAVLGFCARGPAGSDRVEALRLWLR